MADVVTSYDARKLAWSFEYQPVVKHLDLYLCALDVVGSVAASVDRHLLNDELRVVAFCYELGMLSQERMLTNLRLDKLNRFLDLVQNGSLKSHILDDVHLGTHLLVNTLVSDEASTGTGEELLGMNCRFIAGMESVLQKANQ